MDLVDLLQAADAPAAVAADSAVDAHHSKEFIVFSSMSRNIASCHEFVATR